MNPKLEFRFHIPFTGTVDRDRGIIKGVSLMTGNLTAEGHDLEVDETTLKQVLQCAKKTGKIPVKLDHGSGITSLCGYIDGATAQIDGEKVRGDWHLLTSHDEYDTLMERAEKMPECFGLSAAFKGGGEVLRVGTKAGKKAARCERLLAVDCVTQPAANPDGLFSAAVDTSRKGMSDTNQSANQALPADTPEWARQLLTKVDGAIERIASIEGFQQDLQDSLNEPDLAQLANMSDEQLDAAGYDVQAVRGAVEQAIASGELVEREAGGDHAGDAGTNGGAAKSSVPAEAPAETAALAAKVAKQTIQQFIAKREEAEEAAAFETAVTTLEAKAEEAAKENERLVTELATKEAKIKALELTLKTSHVRSAGAAVESTVLFTSKNAPAGSFEQLVAAKFEELKGTAGVTEVQARARAIQFCVRSHTAAYADYRARGGQIELASK